MKVVYCFLNEAGEKSVTQLNILLKKLHSESEMLTSLSLADHLLRSKIAIANDPEGKIVGVAVLAPRYLLTHVAAGIHGLVVSNEYEGTEVGEELIKLLVAFADGSNFVHIDIDVDNDATSRHEILERCGFKKRNRSQFRRKAPKKA